MSKIFYKFFGSAELKAVLGILDEACHKFNTKTFEEIIRPKIEKPILSNPQKVRQILKKIPPREWLYGIIANIAGDLLESGEYHIYRGVLSSRLSGTGPGQDLLEIFDKATDELVKIGNISTKFAKEQKLQLRKNIKEVG